MTERETGSAGEDGTHSEIELFASESGRLGNPTRLIPRQPPPEEESLGVTPRPAVFEGELEPQPPPTAFGRPGRIQVWGCSPGCLIASLIASLMLTLLLNAMF